MTSPEWIPPVLLRAAGAAVLLYSMCRAARFFSAQRQHDAVRELQTYFNDSACPRSELAPHLRSLPLNQGALRAGKPPRAETSCPEQWLELEAAELDSPYYLRTGQQISSQASLEPAGSWYGLEAWIRDLLASRGDPPQNCGSEKAERKPARPFKGSSASSSNQQTGSGDNR